MPELHRLHTDHAPAVLAFGPTNRAYFSDPGDEFYDQFTERRSALLAEQAVDIGAFYFRALDGSVLVWFIDFDNGHACSGHH